MIEQALDPAEISALEVHFDSCDRCREVVGWALGSKPSGSGSSIAGVTPIGPGQGGDPEGLLGMTIAERYRVTSLLGRGGMGTVYLARDTKLDRNVAIKVHRAGASTDRLQREAIAMAQLAHPNVVNVFEVGTVDTWMYVVMEYVRGATLREWIATAQRRWQDVVDLLLDAGTGLAAAHAAGLVHRDFKPDNVLVGSDGRPRVSDFGLARADHTAGEPALPSTTLDTPITVEGTVLGTPAYMPPEQLAGDPVDARGDQFAFAVVAWACLYGRRPFDGATLGALQVAIEQHEIQRPGRTAVPARVGAVLERALAVAPDQRYPDVPALLAALRRAAAPRTTRWLAIAGATSLALTLVAFPVRSKIVEHRHAAACADQAGEVEDVFGQRARAAIQAGFLATGAPNAQSNFDVMQRVLDRHAHTLAARTETACTARVEPARRSCLTEQTSELTGLVETLSRPDASLVRRAPDAAWAIFDPTPCDDVSFVPVPATRTKDQTTQLGRIRALSHTGKYKEAIPVATVLLESARTSQDRGLELAVLLELASLRAKVDPPKQVIAVLQEAQALAETLGRDFEAAVSLEALADLAIEERQYADAHRNIGLARAKIARMGGANPVFDAKLLMEEAKVLVSEYRFEESEAVQRKAVAALTTLLGADHKNVGAAYGTLSQILLAQNKGPEALAASRQALQILEGALGPDHPTVAGARMTVGQTLIEVGRLDEAKTQLLAADAVFARVFGPKHPIRTGIYGRIGRIERSQEHPEPALAAFRTALSFVEGLEGARSLEAAGALSDIAVTLASQGKFAEAAIEAKRAVAIIERNAPDDGPRLSSALVDVATILRAGGKHAKSIPIAERALGIIATLGDATNPSELSAIRFALAQALWDGHGDRARARKLAGEALLGEPEPSTRTEIETWLAQHRR
jgi:tetratricopeptide (TPR) repeat protein/tRNA A-37 threonylcarbamoyl transferase component Bud32